MRTYARHFIDEDEIGAVIGQLESGWLARGDVNERFERAVAEYIGSDTTVVACANGSVALEIALRALGIGPGHEVIVPDISWVSTASAVNLVGAMPVLCDVESTYPNLSVESVAKSITARTRAIVPVHFAGVACDMSGLYELCNYHGIDMVEDAAHAIGGRYPGGDRIGSWPNSIVCFSLHPAKNITTGEGGLVVTTRADIVESLRAIRSNGVVRSARDGAMKAMYDVVEIASNHHITSLAAAIGLEQIKKLDSFIKRRAELWAHYNRSLSSVPGVNLYAHPSHSGFNLCIAYVSGDRDRLLMRLNEKGIGAYFHYPPIHGLSVYRKNKSRRIIRSSLKNSEAYARTAITLPLYPALSKSDVDSVCNTLIDLQLCSKDS